MDRIRQAGLALVAALVLIGCGVEASVETTGEPEPALVTEASAGEFVYMLAPEKRELIREVVEAVPACAETEVDSAMLILVSVRASEGDPERPVQPVIEQSCPDG